MNILSFFIIVYLTLFSNLSSFVRFNLEVISAPLLPLSFSEPIRIKSIVAGDTPNGPTTLGLEVTDAPVPCLLGPSVAL